MVPSFLATLAMVGLAAWWFSPTATGATQDTNIVPSQRAGDKSTIQWADLLRPDDDTGNGSLVAPSPDAPPPQWVMRPPARSTQHELSSEARGGNPCMSDDPGFGVYDDWDRSPFIGQMLVPKQLKLNEAGEFAVVFHFHGHSAARKQWVQAVDDAVLVGIDLGLNSGPYLNRFANPHVFESLLDDVEAQISRRLGTKARIGKLGLSSWSAGYGAVSRILESNMGEYVDAVMLLDGLHTGPADSKRAQITLRPFVEFARLASTNDRMMFVSHSSILPPGYASTTETANYLVWQLGGTPKSASATGDDPMGLELIRSFTHGDFHVRGFSGNGKMDHCAHIGLYRKVLREYLAPRWNLKLASL